MYRNILLAAALQNWEHYSAHALAARDVAATLARHAERLHVLTVYENEPAVRIPSSVPADMAAKFREQQVDQAERDVTEKMDDYVGVLTSQGIAVNRLIRLGSPRHLIVDMAQELEADLIVIGSHSKRGFLDIALGGTAKHVSEHAPCPVVMVTPKAKK
jgi:nucleotide-binding universal stress UspA family protein